MRIIRIENNSSPYIIDVLLEILKVFKQNLYIAPKEGYTDYMIGEVAKKIEQHIFLNLKESNYHQPYGWVYIINLKSNNNIIKIGLTKSNKAEYRSQVISDHSHPGMNPEMTEVELYYARLASDCRKVEKEMHDFFKEYNLKGEWFKVDCKVAKKKLDQIINKIDTPHLRRV